MADETIAESSTTPDMPESEQLIEPVLQFNSPHEWETFVANDVAQLHKELEKFVPIVGVAALNAETPALDSLQYRVDYADGASQQQIADAAAFLHDWPTYRYKQLKRQLNYKLLDDWFANEISTGCTVVCGDTSFQLGLTDNDLTLLAGNYMLAQTASIAGLPLPQIIDRTGIVRTIPTIVDFSKLMLQYGNHRADISKKYAAKKAAIDAALSAL